MRTNKGVKVSDSSEESPPPAAERSLTGMAKGNEVSVGCGSLILIAIIVSFWSGAGKTDSGPLMNKLNEMDAKIQRLETKVDELNKKLADR